MASGEGIMYLVVEFEKECGFSAMEVVPETWRDEDGCRCILYPDHYSNDKAVRAAKRAECPTDKWKSFPIKKEWFKSASWDAANRRCNKLLDTSNVDTSESEDESMAPRKRISKHPRRFVDSPSPQRKIPKTSRSTSSVISSNSNVVEMSLPLPSPPRAPVISGNMPSAGLTTSTPKQRSNATVPQGPRSSSTSTSSGMTGGSACGNTSSAGLFATPQRQGSSATVPQGPRPSSTSTSRDMTGGSACGNTSSAGLFATPPRQGSSATVPQGPRPSTSTSRDMTGGSAFETRVFSLLEKILEKQRAHDTILRAIAERQRSLEEHGAGDEENELPQLPCDSAAELMQLEETLRGSEAAQKKLMRVLSLVGGQSLKAMVSNVMKKLTTHQLSKQFNVTGAKGKASFLQYKTLIKILFKSIRHSTEYKNATEQDIKVAMGTWFTNSRDRNGDRINRTRQNVPAREVEQPAGVANGHDGNDENENNSDNM